MRFSLALLALMVVLITIVELDSKNHEADAIHWEQVARHTAHHCGYTVESRP